MAATSRDSNADVSLRFQEQPWRFDFFQAVRMALRARPALLAPGMHGLPAREAVRFYGSSSLSFPASIIESIDSVPPRKPAAGVASPFHFVVAVLGLTGYSGILPYFYSEFTQTYGAEALEEFLDLFNHRLISLEYRAWEKSRPQFAAERELHAAGLPLKKQFAALLGASADPMLRRSELPEEAQLRAAGQFAQLPRSLANLRALLISNLGRSVEIDQFQGQWCELTPSETATIGCRQPGFALGAGAVLGTKIWYQQASFRIRLPHVTFEEYLAMLPGGRPFGDLIEWVRSFTKGMFQQFEIELELEESVPMGHRMDLRGPASPRLGWFGWLGASDRRKAVRRQVVFRSDERVATVREIVHKALATVRGSLLAERKIRLEWSEEVMQALMDANAHTESGGSQMIASTAATLHELMRGPIMRASRLLTRVIESLRTEARTRNIAASFDRNDPQTFKDTDTIQVNVQGVDQAKTQEFRSIVADKAPDWILTPVNATDYRLNMKVSALILSAPERRIRCEVA